MKVFWTIVFFDLRRVLSDKFVALWLLILPLLFAFIFGMVFQSSPEDNRVLLHVIDLDQSQFSNLLINNLDEDQFIIQRETQLPQTPTDTWTPAIIIPATFTESITQNIPARFQYLQGQETPDIVLNIQAHLSELTLRMLQSFLKVDRTIDTQQWITALNAQLNQRQDVVVDIMQTESLQPPPSGFNLTLPGYLVMFVLQMTLIYGGVTLVEDRTEGQYSRLLIAPLPSLAIFIAKIVSRIMLALFQASLLLWAGWLFFGIPLGDPFALTLILITFAACIGSLSLLIGMFCNDVPQVTSVAIFLTLTLSPLSGCWWPIEIVPDWLFQIAQVLPTYWCLRGIQDILYYNHNLIEVLPIVGILMAFTTGFLFIAFLQSKRLH